jgi:hypothetical protein
LTLVFRMLINYPRPCWPIVEMRCTPAHFVNVPIKPQPERPSWPWSYHVQTRHRSLRS